MTGTRTELLSVHSEMSALGTLRLRSRLVCGLACRLRRRLLQVNRSLKSIGLQHRRSNPAPPSQPGSPSCLQPEPQPAVHNSQKSRARSGTEGQQLRLDSAPLRPPSLPSRPLCASLPAPSLQKPRAARLPGMKHWDDMCKCTFAWFGSHETSRSTSQTAVHSVCRCTGKLSSSTNGSQPTDSGSSAPAVHDEQPKAE